METTTRKMRENTEMSPFLDRSIESMNFQLFNATMIPIQSLISTFPQTRRHQLVSGKLQFAQFCAQLPVCSWRPI